MSLFDVIRYPISDIFKEDELSMLPEELYQAWFKRCAGTHCQVLLPNRVNEIKVVITTQSIASAKANRVNTTGYPYEDLWKAIFTKMLKEMIAEYDVH